VNDDVKAPSYKSVLVGLLLVTGVYAEPFGKMKVSKAEGPVIKQKSGVETGPGAKVELDMLDGSLVRVGANARFSYTPGTREAKLDNGTMLFSSPKNAGGVTLTAGGTVTSAVGAVDFEAANFGGNVKVISLNGKPTISLGESRKGLRPGQIMAVPAGATKLPKADVVNLKTLLATGGLMKMGKLPSQSAIERNANNQVRNPTFRLGLNMDAYDGGPMITAAMVQRMQEQQVLSEGPVVPTLKPNQVPTQLQVAEFKSAGVPVPASNVQALERSGSTVSGDKIKPLPPPVPVATPRPLPTPVPRPTLPPRPPVAGHPTPRPPIFRPPIAPP
jgi:acrosin